MGTKKSRTNSVSLNKARMGCDCTLMKSPNVTNDGKPLSAARTRARGSSRVRNWDDGRTKRMVNGRLIIIIIINEFHRDASLKENFRA